MASSSLPYCRYCRVEFHSLDTFTAHVRRFHGIEGLASQAADRAAWRKNAWSVLRIAGVFVAVLLIFYFLQ